MSSAGSGPTRAAEGKSRDCFRSWIATSGESRKDDAAYLDTCRIKRNEIEYDAAGAATDTDADELLEFATTLRGDVLGWLKTNRPEFLKP